MKINICTVCVLLMAIFCVCGSVNAQDLTIASNTCCSAGSISTVEYPSVTNFATSQPVNYYATSPLDGNLLNVWTSWNDDLQCSGGKSSVDRIDRRRIFGADSKRVHEVWAFAASWLEPFRFESGSSNPRTVADWPISWRWCEWNPSSIWTVVTRHNQKLFK